MALKKFTKCLYPVLTGATNNFVKQYDGTGVKLAIIDVGFSGLSAAITANEVVLFFNPGMDE